MNISSIGETGFRVSVARNEAHAAILHIAAVCESHGVKLFPTMGEEDDKGTFLNVQFVEEQTLSKVEDIIKELQTGIPHPSYMVTTASHGRMHLNPMRFFTGADAERDARSYAASIPREDGLAVMYEVRHNAPPTQVGSVYQGRATRGV